jgi:hypothetical protein
MHSLFKVPQVSSLAWAAWLCASRFVYVCVKNTVTLSNVLIETGQLFLSMNLPSTVALSIVWYVYSYVDIVVDSCAFVEG